jgi:hypothetical protein
MLLTWLGKVPAILQYYRAEEPSVSRRACLRRVESEVTKGAGAGDYRQGGAARDSGSRGRADAAGRDSREGGPALRCNIFSLRLKNGAAKDAR